MLLLEEVLGFQFIEWKNEMPRKHSLTPKTPDIEARGLIKGS